MTQQAQISINFFKYEVLGKEIDTTDGACKALFVYFFFFHITTIKKNVSERGKHSLDTRRTKKIRLLVCLIWLTDVNTGLPTLLTPSVLRSFEQAFACTEVVFVF